MLHGWKTRNLFKTLVQVKSQSRCGNVHFVRPNLPIFLMLTKLIIRFMFAKAQLPFSTRWFRSTNLVDTYIRTHQQDCDENVIFEQVILHCRHNIDQEFTQEKHNKVYRRSYFPTYFFVTQIHTPRKRWNEWILYETTLGKTMRPCLHTAMAVGFSISKLLELPSSNRRLLANTY